VCRVQTDRAPPGNGLSGVRSKQLPLLLIPAVATADVVMEVPPNSSASESELHPARPSLLDQIAALQARHVLIKLPATVAWYETTRLEPIRTDTL